MSLAFAMCWSIGSVFFALFPVVSAQFGVELARSSQIGLFSLAAYMLIIGVVLTLARRKIALAGGGVAGLSFVLSAFFGVIVLGALAAAAGLLPGPTHGWFATAITLLMVHATAELGLLVVNVVRPSE